VQSKRHARSTVAVRFGLAASRPPARTHGSERRTAAARTELPCAREHAALRVVQPQTAMGEFTRLARGSEKRPASTAVAREVPKQPKRRAVLTGVPPPPPPPPTVTTVRDSAVARASVRRHAADRRRQKPGAVMSADDEVGEAAGRLVETRGRVPPAVRDHGPFIGTEA
jgi:hypothetical protein